MGLILRLNDDGQIHMPPSDISDVPTIGDIRFVSTMYTCMLQMNFPLKSFMTDGYNANYSVL